MRIFLQNYETGEFFKAAGQWIGDWIGACEFPSPEKAIEVARELRLPKVQLIMLNQDGRPMMGTRLEFDS